MLCVFFCNCRRPIYFPKLQYYNGWKILVGYREFYNYKLKEVYLWKCNKILVSLSLVHRFSFLLKNNLCHLWWFDLKVSTRDMILWLLCLCLALEFRKETEIYCMSLPVYSRLRVLVKLFWQFSDEIRTTTAEYFIYLGHWKWRLEVAGLLNHNLSSKWNKKCNKRHMNVLFNSP